MEVSIRSQLEILEKRCPVLCPSIFPRYFCPKTIDDITQGGPEQVAKIRTLLRKKNIAYPCISFPTKINLEKGEITVVSLKGTSSVDATLYSLEKMIGLFITGGEEELAVLRDRFIELNGHSHLGLAARRRFVYETYNLAYALKVIVSNLPGGVRVVLSNGTILPFDKTADELEHLISRGGIKVDTRSLDTSLPGVSASSTRNSGSISYGDEGGGSDEEEDAFIGDGKGVVHDPSIKKRKRKRGGAKK